ncbi:MAG: glycosyltransferase family 9 protein [Phreatobacter sp.]|uniref:glycosyltransferase family 9 protein n=1 Tax=Phreatobacter sp. TaxID=1966341 RepID=UPI001A47548F|nr:glycosyltransferase family 9 protein [Phreatobacter sp.]MBL8571880.1 glycosyltransferase family 9 protein [Phreatobacter sp.]
MIPDSPRPETVVLQGLPGIGDALWHLPACRAIAAASAAGRIVLAAPARTQGARLFAAEPWFGGAIDLARGWAGLRPLAAALRAGGFARAIILHHSPTLAVAAWLAGIPERHGFGYGAQRVLLSSRIALEASLRRAPQLARVEALLRRLAIEPVAPTPLAVAPDAARRVAARLAAMPAPRLALGLGASEAFKRWPVPAMARFVADLAPGRWPSVLLLGAAADAPIGAAVAAAAARRGVDVVCDLALDESAALLATVDRYVGPDSGLLNLALAMGIPSTGLFGATPVFTRDRRLSALVPPGGPSAEGMAAITPQAVLATLTPRA